MCDQGRQKHDDYGASQIIEDLARSVERGGPGNTMTDEECAVRITAGDMTETKIGIRVTGGPKTYRLLLTRPMDKEGLIEEIAVDSIEAVLEVESGPRGEPPVIVEE